MQRDRFANLEKAKPKEYFDIPNLERICKSVRAHAPRQAVCSKEIRFLEHTNELVDAAQRLDVPLTLLYLIRDPRAVVISQLWNYPKLRFKKDKDLRVMGKQLMQEHCRCGGVVPVAKPAHVHTRAMSLQHRHAPTITTHSYVSANSSTVCAAVF
jgi:hypothetical protein